MLYPYCYEEHIPFVLTHKRYYPFFRIFVRSLEEGEFLNDVIIDFVLTHLHQEVLNVEDRPFVHVFK